jgi:hypothetical protein
VMPTTQRDIDVDGAPPIYGLRILER